MDRPGKDISGHGVGPRPSFVWADVMYGPSHQTELGTCLSESALSFGAFGVRTHASPVLYLSPSDEAYGTGTGANLKKMCVCH